MRFLFLFDVLFGAGLLALPFVCWRDYLNSSRKDRLDLHDDWDARW